MNAQTLTQPILVCSLFPIFRSESLPHKSEIQVSSLEFGYEIDEGDLYIELSALPSKNHQNQENQGIQPQEFEARFTWFLS